ncbi:MAG: protein kinase [bacterium]|nr:protein kinase [bacterium]
MTDIKRTPRSFLLLPILWIILIGTAAWGIPPLQEAPSHGVAPPARQQEAVRKPLPPPPGKDALEALIVGLEKRLEKAEGKERIRILLKLGDIFSYRRDSARSAQYSNKVLKAVETVEAAETEIETWKIHARILIGISTHRQGNAAGALAIFKQCESASQPLGNTKLQARAQLNLGYSYYQISKYDLALLYFKKCLPLLIQNNQIGRSISIYDAIGTTYMRLADYKNALQYQLKSLDLAEKNNLNNKISSILNGIGLTYRYLDNFEKSRHYLERAWDIARKLQTSSNTLAIIDNLGELYYWHFKDSEKSLEHFIKGLTMAEKFGSKRFTALFLSRLSVIQYHAHRLDAALDYCRRSVDIAQEIKDHLIYIKSTANLGEIYTAKKQYEKGLQFLHSALKSANEIKAKDQIKTIYLKLAEAYEAKSDHKTALRYHKLFYKQSFELLNEVTSKKVTEIQTRYDTLEKEKKIQLLEKDNEAQRENRNFLFAALILAVILLALLVKRFIYLLSFWKSRKYIAHYRIVEEIGSGGVGIVYKAHSIKSKSDQVAIKVLREEYSRDETTRQRFKSEGSIIDKLSHPNIVNIREKGIYNDRLYLVMELLNGETLQQRIQREGAMEMTSAMSIMGQVADAIFYIHGKSIFHRDLKPANIILVADEEKRDTAKLLDFGLAREKFRTTITTTGVFMGTISYMPPEQLSGLPFSPRGDIFAMGVIFYEMLSGKSAFPGTSAPDVIRKILTETPVRLSDHRPATPPALCGLVEQMMDKSPEARPSLEAIVEVISASTHHLQ